MADPDGAPQSFQVEDDSEKHFNRVALLVAGPFVLGIGALAVYLAIHSASCATTIATVPLKGLDQANEMPLKLDAGTGLFLGLYVDRYSYSGYNTIVIDVRLLRNDVEVAKHSCGAFYFPRGAGSGGGRTKFESKCVMDVPPGGSTAIRVTATKSNTGNALTVGRLDVLLRKRE